MSSIPSKKSDFTAPSFAVISATASICVALAACGSGGDPTSTDTGAPIAAPEVKSDTPATDAAGNPIDHHAGDLTDNRLELALAPAPDLLVIQTPQDPPRHLTRGHRPSLVIPAWGIPAPSVNRSPYRILLQQYLLLTGLAPHQSSPPQQRPPTVVLLGSHRPNSPGQPFLALLPIGSK